MVKKPSRSILYKECLKKIMLIFGICSFLVTQNSFQALATSGLKSFKSDDLQQRSITGRVIDSKNLPLVGVNVIEKGTTNGVISGLDGKFTITVASSSSTLLFSFVGYEPSEMVIGNQNNIEITLAESITGLNEVVVIGYGTARKKDITGSVASVNSSTLQEVPTSNIINGLKGRAAGIDIVSNNTLPGSSSQIRIRGNRQMATTA